MAIVDKELKLFLLNKIRNRPELWDRENESYHNKLITSQLWKMLAGDAASSGFIVDPEDLKTLWKNLKREYYHHWMHFVSGNFSSNPTWPFYPMMQFLNGQLESRIRIRADSTKGTDAGSVSRPAGITKSKTHPNRLTNASNCNLSGFLLDIQKEKLRIKKEKMLLESANNEDFAFFKSIVPHVKDLSPSDKMLFRMKMQRLIYQFIGRRGAPEQRGQPASTEPCTQSSSNNENVIPIETDLPHGIKEEIDLDGDSLMSGENIPTASLYQIKTEFDEAPRPVEPAPEQPTQSLTSPTLLKLEFEDFAVMAATKLQKINEQNEKQRYYCEKLINDALHLGVLEKLTDKSEIREK